VDENALQRRLVAILAADVVGFSRLTGADEDRTLARLRALRSDLIDPTIAVHNGRVVKRTGDGVITEFRSVVDAVRCAVEIQNAMIERNAGVPPERRIEFRIGVHLGDVVEERDGDLMGDGVNIAARLEGVAAPGAICLSEDAYRQVRSRLDFSVSDLGETRLKNISEPMRIYSLQVGITADAKSGPREEPKASVPSGLPEKPSIAVLPFKNMSGDPEQEYFSDGITEDIITELSRFRSVSVIARHSSFAFKGKSVTLQEIGRDLGAQYLLEGSVRRLGNRVRITAQLIDARTSAHIWAERLDRELADLFAMQDEVTERIVTTIANRMEKTEQERVAGKRPEAMRAYDYILRARAIIAETAEANQQARSLYEKALELEPKSIPALLGIGWSYLIDMYGRWNSPEDNVLERAHQLARKALSIDNGDYRVHLLMSNILRGQRQYSASLAHCQQAMALNPNDADGAAHMGNLLVLSGQFLEALDWMQKAIRLNPLHPAWYLYAVGEAHYGARQYEQALAPLQEAVNRFPTFITPRRHLAATYAQMGRLDEARVQIAKIRELDPSINVNLYRGTLLYENPDDLEHYLDGLRKAGLPE
jgi:adenylate cyclase